MNSVSDICDWSLPELRYFEGFLRCAICRDFYNVPVTLKSCKHTFCSLCIRQHFSVTLECPVCRKHCGETYELEPNHTVDEIVEAFKLMRRPIMQALEKSGPDADKSDQTACPICSLPCKTSEVEQHVDKCLQASQMCDKQPNTRQPMSKPVFTLMKDAQLRRILGDFSLPTSGDRNTLVKRISDYITMYNVECDARRPKSVERIRCKVMDNERAQQKGLPRQTPDYDEKSKSQMAELVARAKRPKQDTHTP